MGGRSCFITIGAFGDTPLHRCHSSIEGGSLQWQGDHYHPYHFQCAGCRVELTATAREVKSRPGLAANVVIELYCLRCHDKMNIPICGACRYGANTIVANEAKVGRSPQIYARRQ